MGIDVDTSTMEVWHDQDCAKFSSDPSLCPCAKKQLFNANLTIDLLQKEARRLLIENADLISRLNGRKKLPKI
jgi:hypothetical protein